MEIWVAATEVLKDMDEEYEPSGAKLMELLFEHSLDKHANYVFRK